MSTFAIILAAAGQSSRYGDPNYKKPFAPLDGKAVWLHSAERFNAREDVKQLVVVIAEEDEEFFQAKYGANLAFMGIESTVGGGSRAESVQRGLQLVRDDIDFVAVHDAARPVFADVWIDTLFQKAVNTGAAIFATPVASTVKQVSDQKIEKTIDRNNLWLAQTPQVFQRELIVQAHRLPDAASATDDAELVQRLGRDVTVVPGSPLNLKITTREDMKIASMAIKALPKPKLQHPGNPLDDMWS